MGTVGPIGADFIATIYPKAKEVSQKTGIALELILAQAAVETGWGTRIKGNNLFNIKADKSWTGETVEFVTTEYIKDKRVTIVDKFRAYTLGEKLV
jgi:flagellar protein FlgJ